MTCPAGHPSVHMWFWFLVGLCVLRYIYQKRFVVRLPPSSLHSLQLALSSFTFASRGGAGARGFQSYSEAKYDTIQLDTLPETALESVGERWDPPRDMSNALTADDFEEDAPALLALKCASSNVAEETRPLNRMETAAGSIPRIGAPLGMRESISFAADEHIL